MIKNKIKSFENFLPIRINVKSVAKLHTYNFILDSVNSWNHLERREHLSKMKDQPALADSIFQYASKSGALTAKPLRRMRCYGTILGLIYVNRIANDAVSDAARRETRSESWNVMTTSQETINYPLTSYMLQPEYSVCY